MATPRTEVSAQTRFIGDLLHFAARQGCQRQQVDAALEALGVEPTEHERRVIDHCFLR